MELDLVSLIVKVPADRSWREVEARLNRSGLTLGFVPPVPDLPAIGALLEAGARGLRGGLMGTLAERCTAVEAEVEGHIERTPVVPRSAAGPDLRHLAIGGAGRHTRLTTCWIRVEPRAEASRGLHASAPTATLACRALADAIHRGAFPHVTLLSPLAEGWVLDLLFEGAAPLVEARAAITSRILRAHGLGLGDPAEAEAALGRLEASVDALTPPRPLPWDPSLELVAPWSTAGAAADALHRACPDAPLLLTHAAATQLSLLLGAVDAPTREAALLAATAAGAWPVLPSELDRRFAAMVGLLSPARTAEAGR